MLKIRQRGKYWHARGTIKAAGKSYYFQERSTGETKESLARSWAIRKEVEIQNDLRDGRPLQSSSITFAMAADRLSDIREIPYRDNCMLIALTAHFGDMRLADINAADWNAFVLTRGRGARPAAASTIDRYLYVFRSVFDAMKPEGAKRPDVVSPRTAKARRNELRARLLTTAEADALIRCYDPRVRRIATVLRYQGLRTQECLQLDRRHIDMQARTIFVDKSKNGFARTVKMHPKTYTALKPLMKEARARVVLPSGRIFEPLFLTDKGKPYPDTRDDSSGNPMKTAHATACKKAGVSDFTPHDWRRHWACWMLKHGTDPWTLMQMGGWTNLKSIEPYIQAAARDMDRQAEALARVA